MKKIITYALAGWFAFALSVNAGEKSKAQKEHDAAWQKIVEKQKELKEARKRFEKQIQELIKELKKVN